MQRTLSFSCLCLIVAGVALAGNALAPPPDETAAIGRAVPDVAFFDENGGEVRLSQLSGPVIISPIFTECPHACGAITSSLRDAILKIDGLGRDWHVVSVTFDPEDSEADLRQYRVDYGIPDGWIVTHTDSTSLATLFTAIDFNYTAFDGGGFAHPNIIAIVDEHRVVSGYVHGLSYTETDIRRALTSAWAGTSLIEKFKGWILVAMVVGALLVVITIVATGRKPARNETSPATLGDRAQ